MPRCKKSIDDILSEICDGTITEYSQLEEILNTSQFNIQTKQDILEQFFKFKLDRCIDPSIIEIESSTLQGCWQDATTGDQVSVEIIRDEDGSFKYYEIHTVSGITTAETLTGYEPCKCAPLSNSGLVTDISNFN